MHSGIRVAVVGDYDENRASHQAIPKALAAAPDIEAIWISTGDLAGPDALNAFDGVWCAPGMPYRSAEGALSAIRHARLTHKPFLGTSSGFQYALIEYARYVLGLSGAGHQMTEPRAKVPLVSPLACALAGVSEQVSFIPGSRLRRAYGAGSSVEKYYCSFGLNNRYRRLLEGCDLYIAAYDERRDVRAVELDGHPFYVATLFQPELRSQEGGAVSPIVTAFAAACRHRAGKGAAGAVG